MKKGMGWLRDYPDFRDYTPDHPKILEVVEKRNGGVAKKTGALPEFTQNSQYVPKIRDQGSVGICTGFTGTGSYQYSMNRAHGTYIELSPAFLYKMSRKMLNLKGDTGSYLRTTMGAMALFGCPPEKYWPYSEKTYDKEPDPFVYQFAQAFQALKYFRLDESHLTPAQILARIKGYLARGYPVMFGFTVYTSIERAESNGQIPFPTPGDKVDGGHAVYGVDFDDRVVIPSKKGYPETKGAIIGPNSWSDGWGNQGFFALPYAYILKGLADDFWSMTKAEWVDTGKFDE